MRDITEQYPSYEDLITSMDVAILLKVDDNDYQGDSRVLVHDGHRYGLLFFGWGSCSGCDALEAASGDHDELIALRDQMYREIHWEDSASALIAYIDGKDWSLDFRGSNEADRAFRGRAQEILRGIVAGRTVDAAPQRLEIDR